MFARLSNVKNAVRPEILVVDPVEIAKTVSAAYNPITNTMYVNAAILGKGTRNQLQNIFVSGNKIATTFYHEGLHWSDAWKHINKGNKITAENYEEYISMLDAKDKRKLDKAGITADNASKISEYAKNSYDDSRYNEAYTEYRVKQKFKKEQ